MLPLQQGPGHLAENVTHFARVLRAAGMPVGSDRIQLALQALQVAGLQGRRDFHAVLSACLLGRIEHRELFDQAFELFWRDPDLEGRMRALLLPQVQAKEGPQPAPENRRLAEALFPPNPQEPPQPPPPAQQLELDAALTFSAREQLQKADFETMSADEWRQAQRLLAQLRVTFAPVRTRRSMRASRPGRPDWRATLQTMARHGGELWNLRWRQVRTKPPPIVVLADISGSMSRYSRMLLHFAHLLGHADAKVESFVFGTRLTRTTRLLYSRDPDVAVAEVVRAVQDWSGGTRIAQCLHEFNHRWARRVLSGNATVLLITDGLEACDGGDAGSLAFEMERLHKSCRELVWLNPLLRFSGFQPRAAGIRSMLPHVDRFMSAHNLQSLAELVQVLGGSARPQRARTTTPSPTAAAG
ncbi:MAG: hypothetical protein ABS84_00435 [Rubrivivax sp. SCN 71-131]|nr:MAG: hypothetical protein ABS84_00435 [Rubrivivax sp. SCN 71-131]